MAFEKKYFPNSGALFGVKVKKTDKAPDLTGDLYLGPDTLAYILAQHQAGNREIGLELSAWKKVSKAGNKFLSVSVKKPFEKTGVSSAPKQASWDDEDTDGPPF